MLGAPACSALLSLACPQPSSAVPGYCLPFGEKCCGLGGKGQKSTWEREEIARKEPKAPIAVKQPQNNVPGARGLEQNEGRWEQNEGRWEQVHLRCLKIHLRCVLGIPGGLSLPTLYLRHLSGISHQSAEAPGSRDRVRPRSLRTGQTGPREQVVSPGLPGSPKVATRVGESRATTPGLERI